MSHHSVIRIFRLAALCVIHNGEKVRDQMTFDLDYGRDDDVEFIIRSGFNAFSWSIVRPRPRYLTN